MAEGDGNCGQESEGRMTHKNNEWFRGKPEQTGRYYWGGCRAQPDIEKAARNCGYTLIAELPHGYGDGWWVRVGDLDPIPPVPVPRPEKIDTPVLVRSGDCQHWFRRYLAGWTEEGLIRTFACGQTSWTTEGERYEATWDHWKLPEDE